MLKYELMVGLNDKDKLYQVIDNISALKIVNNVLTKNGIGAYNVVENQGFFTNELGKTTIEKSLLITIIVDTELKNIKDIISTLKVVLNQESIGLMISKINVEWC